MSIKSIVAPVRGDGKGEWVLGLALAIGGKFNAPIDVLHIHATPQDMIPFGVPLSRAFQASILDAAEKVSVLVADEADAVVGQGRSIQRYLRLHGVESGVEPFRVGRQDVGAALLAKASAIGADMIVMGAFGARKRSELVLGGVTQFMLENAELPLVMAH